jgi:ADP-ribosylglycohydrolase
MRLRLWMNKLSPAGRGRVTILEDRFTGCLIGQALGDALGFLVEGFPGGHCDTYVRDVVRPRCLPSQLRGSFGFGQYSDDTQLARELCLSLVAVHPFEPADYASRIAALFVEHRIVGRGRATEESALRLASGVPWYAAGTPAPSAGNGSAMRAAPIGLVYADNPTMLVQIAHTQSSITHQDTRCSAGSVVIAGATALALKDGPLVVDPFCRQLADWARPFDATMAAFLEELPTWIGEPKSAVLERVRASNLEGAEDWDGISPFVTESVLWSLYAFLASPDDYWEAVCSAIAVGGDVDTTAAMTGAIAGARSGLAVIPWEFAAALTDQGAWGYSELLGLARSLVSVRQRVRSSIAPWH